MDRKDIFQLELEFQKYKNDFFKKAKRDKSILETDFIYFILVKIRKDYHEEKLTDADFVFLVDRLFEFTYSPEFEGEVENVNGISVP